MTVLSFFVFLRVFVVKKEVDAWHKALGERPALYNAMGAPPWRDERTIASNRRMFSINCSGVKR